ncbi:MAG: hypothetical protein ABSE15_09175 [Candidatus Bathyarchaeia archaeon]|jgi:hypothetical protein
MPEKKLKLTANISSANPSAIKPVLERIIGSNGTIKPTTDGFDVNADFKGETAKNLNRTILSELRRAEKKTRLRAEWASDGTVEKYFDYVLKQTRKT